MDRRFLSTFDHAHANVMRGGWKGAKSVSLRSHHVMKDCSSDGAFLD
jgi:hypothetical protein